MRYRRNGERCKRYALQGTTVCKHHGGAALQIQAAAKVRLENDADRMAKQLLGIATDENVSAETRLKAIVNALDRTIGKAPTTIEIGPAKPYETVFDGIGGRPSESQRDSVGYDPAGSSTESFPTRDLTDPTLPSHIPSQHNTQGDQASGRAYPSSTASTDGASGKDEEDGTLGAEYADMPSRHDAPRPPRPRGSDRDTVRQPLAHHVTGEDAMRLANQANAENAARYGLPWGESAKRR